jgi:hypothetical protein
MLDFGIPGIVEILIIVVIGVSLLVAIVGIALLVWFVVIKPKSQASSKLCQCGRTIPSSASICPNCGDTT